MTFSQKDAWVQLAQWVEHVVHTNRVNGIDAASIPYDGATPTPEPHDAQAATLAGGVDDWPGAEPGVSAAAGRPDIGQAAARMGWKLGGRREIKRLPEHLYAGEKVAFLAQGAYNNDQGIVAMTDQRLIFVFHGMVRQAVEDFALDRITTVHHKTGLATGTLRVTVSGRTVEISQILKQDLLMLAEALRERIGSGAPQPPPPAVSTPPSDPVEALRKLGELHKAGIVTDDEFAAKKAELLARM